jgi:hypothetical protein
MDLTLSETSRRLFAHVEVETVAYESAGGLIVGRLLEEGESSDLRRLAEEVGEERMAAWVRERGGRQLSRRSRCFWESVLGVAPSASADVAEELWPL